jgi:hypothetical protein
MNQGGNHEKDQKTTLYLAWFSSGHFMWVQLFVPKDLGG